MTTILNFRGLPDRLAEADRDRTEAALLIHLAALATQAPIEDVKAPSRSTARAARTRQIAIYLANAGLGWPVERVAPAFDRARSTVAHACHKVEEFRDRDAFDRRIAAIEAWLQAMMAILAEPPL